MTERRKGAKDAESRAFTKDATLNVLYVFEMVFELLVMLSADCCGIAVGIVGAKGTGFSAVSSVGITAMAAVCAASIAALICVLVLEDRRRERYDLFLSEKRKAYKRLKKAERERGKKHA